MISVIVSRVCDAIWTELVNKVMPEPTEEDWERIKTGFRLQWNFPNCCGAVDGKHIAVRQPPGSGSLFFNYKNYFSIVLMAVVDAGYRFIMVDVGNYGSNLDTRIWKNSIIGRRHINDDLGLPPHKILPGYPEAGLIPHCFVGDEAFGLALNMMRPFPRQRGFKLPEDQTVYNYRHSRARWIIECVFGILVQRFQVFDFSLVLYLYDGGGDTVTAVGAVEVVCCTETAAISSLFHFLLINALVRFLISSNKSSISSGESLRLILALIAASSKSTWSSSLSAICKMRSFNLALYCSFLDRCLHLGAVLLVLLEASCLCGPSPFPSSSGTAIRIVSSEAVIRGTAVVAPTLVTVL